MFHYRSGTKIDGHSVSRVRFLSGLGAAVAGLAACGKSDQLTNGSTLPSMQVRDLAFYMRKTACAMVEFQGVQYYQDGSTKRTPVVPQACSVSPQTAGIKPEYCNSSTPDPTSTTTVVGFSFSNVSSSSLQFGLTEPVYQIGPAIGPIYKSDKEASDCTNPISDAQEIAEKAAEYITENAGTLPTVVVIAAQNAMKNWEGTGLGVAASAEFAMEFLAFLGVALSPLDFLIILAAIGVTIAVAIELWKCFHQ